MKKVQLSFFFLSIGIFTAYAQNQFDGVRSSDYLGVKSVFFNPANIVSNRYKWDVNLASAHVGAGNQNASFNINNLSDQIGNQVDSVLFGANAKAVSAYGGVDVMGPSIMIGLGKKTSIAFTTRARAMLNIHDMDGKLMNAIQSPDNINLPYTLASATNQYIALNGWAEYGLSLGRVLFKTEHQLFKVGISVKYLAGYSNNYMQINNIKGTVNYDANGVYLTSAGGNIQIGEGGADLTKMNTNQVAEFKGNGTAMDFGFVYEHGAKMQKSKKGNNPAGYKWKLSVAILDLGSIRYKVNPLYTADYAMHISSAQKFYMNGLQDSSIAGIKNALGKSPYFRDLGQMGSSYSVAMPTTLVGGIDLNLISRFYLGLEGRLAFNNYIQPANPYYQNNFTITPHYEGRHLGLFIPLNMNGLTGFNAGFAICDGPLIIGSGSIISLLTGSSRQADFYFGLHFGGLAK